VFVCARVCVCVCVRQREKVIAARNVGDKVKHEWNRILVLSILKIICSP